MPAPAPYGLSLMALSAIGCQTANSYAVPTALGRGHSDVTVALEGSRVRSTAKRSGATFPERVSTADGTSVVPTVVVRYGLLDRLDAGIALRGLTSLGADLKVQLVRGPLEVAVMPAGQMSPVQQEADLTVPAGVRLGDRAMVVLSPGLAYVHSSTRENSSEYLALRHSTPLWKLGAGVRAQLRQDLALHPEVTVLRALDASDDHWITVGLGLVAGAR